MAMATISVVTSMLTTYLHFKGSATRAPQFIRFIAFKVLAQIVFLSEEVKSVQESLTSTKINAELVNQSQKEPEMKRNDAIKPISNPELKAILDRLIMISELMKSQKSDEAVMDEWKLLAKIVDRVFFWISLIVLIVIIIVISAK